MVVDASALLAVLFNEPRGEQVAIELAKHPTGLVMSTVTMTDVLIRVMSRKVKTQQEIVDMLRQASIELVGVDTVQARIAAEARLSFPINLGDCLSTHCRRP